MSNSGDKSFPNAQQGNGIQIHGKLRAKLPPYVKFGDLSEKRAPLLMTYKRKGKKYFSSILENC